MLRMMLTAHPDLAIPWESHFIVPLWKGRRKLGGVRSPDVERVVGLIEASSMFQLWEVPETAVRRRVDALVRPTLGNVIEAMFRAYADHQSKPRWGDKTPIYVMWLPALAELFPTARFVHVIRDGRDVALSYMTVPWGPDDIWSCAVKWRRDVGAGRRDGPVLGAERYMEIRYEALVQEPQSALERICEFARLGYDERMLDPSEDRSVGSRASLAAYHASATKPPTPGLRDWRTQMSDEQVLAFEAVAGGLLTDLGYERRYASIPRATRVEAGARIASAQGQSIASNVKKAALRTVRRAAPGSSERDSAERD